MSYLYNEETGMGRGRKGDFMDPFLNAAYNQCSPFHGENGKKSCFGEAEEECSRKGKSERSRKNDRRSEAARKREEKLRWEKKAKRHKLFLDLAQKAWYRRENEREFQEHIAFARKEVSSALLRKQSMERAAGGHMELDANPAVLSEAATELAGNYVFFKIPSARVNPRPGK